MSHFLDKKNGNHLTHIRQDGRFLIEKAEGSGWLPFWQDDQDGIPLPARYNEFLPTIECIVSHIISVKKSIVDGLSEFDQFPQADEFRIIDTHEHGIYRLMQEDDVILLRYPGGEKWEAIPAMGVHTLH
jgi:hypothetical protein